MDGTVGFFSPWHPVALLGAVGRVVLATTLDAGAAHPLNLTALASGTFTVLVRGQAAGEAIGVAKRLVKE